MDDMAKRDSSTKEAITAIIKVTKEVMVTTAITDIKVPLERELVTKGDMVPNIVMNMADLAMGVMVMAGMVMEVMVMADMVMEVIATEVIVMEVIVIGAMVMEDMGMGGMVIEDMAMVDMVTENMVTIDSLLDKSDRKIEHMC